MATIKYLLQSKSTNAPIYLRLSLARDKSFKRKTGLSINPHNWSTTTGLPKQNDSASKNLTIELRYLETFILNKLNEANSNGTEINGDWLTDLIDLHFGRINGNGNSELVTDAIQDIINTSHIRDNGKGGVGLSDCRINAYKRLLSLFKDFQGKVNYSVKELDKKKFEDFKRWLLDENNYSSTYAYKKLSDLKTVCKDARANGVETSTELNDIKTRQVSAYDDDMDVIILTPEEIEKIEKASLKKQVHINARKWLILACYTGQRGQALTQRIKVENFEKYGSDLVIKIRQKKGNKHVIIPVLPKVKEIYENGLPYVISTQKLNKYFKEIGKIAEIDQMIMGRLRDKETNRGVKKLRPKYEYISTHIGRRTFASNHYGKIPTPIIMKVTGHSKESTFLGYINQSDDSHIDTFLEYYKTKELKERKEPQLNVVKNVINN